MDRTPVLLAGLPTALQWAGTPASSASLTAQGLRMDVATTTDLFCDPQGQPPVLNAPRLLFPADRHFTLSAYVTVAFEASYDAGVLLIYEQETIWAKLCCEYSPQQQPMIVSVVTNGRSDDANAVVLDQSRAFLRITGLGEAFAFHYSLDGMTWQLVRWTVPLFVEELGVVRQALGLERVHILGQSWGGMLGMEYALTQPPGLVSLTVADSPASMPQWVAEANRRRAELPFDIQATLLKHEVAGTTDAPAYQEAMLVFYRRHVCRLDPWPECLNRTFDKLAQAPEVYNTMNGPSEFHVIGVIKDWDIVDRLGEIQAPTLVISGRYDEATPAIAETVHRGIPGSEWVLFEHSAHTPHLEESDRFLQVVAGFLDRCEREP